MDNERGSDAILKKDSLTASDFEEIIRVNPQLFESIPKHIRRKAKATRDFVPIVQAIAHRFPASVLRGNLAETDTKGFRTCAEEWISIERNSISARKLYAARCYGVGDYWTLLSAEAPLPALRIVANEIFPSILRFREMPKSLSKAESELLQAALKGKTRKNLFDLLAAIGRILDRQPMGSIQKGRDVLQEFLINQWSYQGAKVPGLAYFSDTAITALCQLHLKMPQLTEAALRKMRQRLHLKKSKWCIIKAAKLAENGGLVLA